ncbi:Fanconi anemia group G protein [Trichomycterus rosablanca]|uniref:Fanconi anemia group G protein n=1 Tax=Trichomycterus rosablanca TaxID=2290929 RepID=UPI002F350D21
MSVTSGLFERWAEENNNIIRKWKKYEIQFQSLQNTRKCCNEELLKLHLKVQGVPALTEQLQLEITISFNTLIFSLGYSTSNETTCHLTNTLVRALEAVGTQEPTSDLVTLWQVVVPTFRGTEYEPWIHKLLLVQWALWLSEGQFEKILHLLVLINHKKQSTLSMDLLAETRNLAISIQEDTLLSSVAVQDLKNILHLTTFISHGVEQMKKEKYSEALLAFQEAITLPSPRALLAHVYTLIGLSFAKLHQPQSALQSYRKALEADFNCQKALYQSSLVYRSLGNSNAEIEAVRLLHSASLLHAERDSSGTSALLVSPDMLLGSEQMTFICQIPSPLHILHTLGQRCVLNDRNSEGAEYYLDLLAYLQSDSKEHIPTKDGLLFPRLPVVYLEAAFALLKAQRFWDAIAICDEVIAMTVDLIPEMLVIKIPMEASSELSALALEPDDPGEKLECVLWSGAAYLLQGQAYLQLNDTKEALTSFTRAINHLVKVHIKQKEMDSVETGDMDLNVVVLKALKAKVLAVRAVCFAERSQLKEALRDFQLSLQVLPGCKNTGMWLVEILWRLDRKEEATVIWRQIHNSAQSPTTLNLPLYLQTWQEDAICFDKSNLIKKMEEFIQSSVTEQ